MARAVDRPALFVLAGDMRAGVSAGALACTQRGCVPAFAMRADIEARLDDIAIA